MVTIKDLREILKEFNHDQLEKLGGLTFALTDAEIKLRGGRWVRGEYFNDSRTIVLYTELIENKADLKEVVLHEIAHVLGVPEEHIRH